MRYKISGTVLLLMCLTASSVSLSATTCVANKKFKVKQVCGRVTDLSGVPIPKVPIELQDEKSVPVREAITDDDGVFTMSDTPKGEYILRVQIRRIRFCLATLRRDKKKLKRQLQQPNANSPRICWAVQRSFFLS